MTEDNKGSIVLLLTILCNLESVAGFASSVFFCWSTSLVSEIAHKAEWLWLWVQFWVSCTSRLSLNFLRALSRICFFYNSVENTSNLTHYLGKKLVAGPSTCIQHKYISLWIFHVSESFGAVLVFRVAAMQLCVPNRKGWEFKDFSRGFKIQYTEKNFVESQGNSFKYCPASGSA